MRANIRSAIFALSASLLASSVALAQTPPTAPPGSVTLPLSEYDRLIERASRVVVPPEAPAVAAVVARAEVQVRLTPTAVRATATLQGEVLRSGRVKVPLLDGATLVDVQQNGAPVPVLNESSTTSALLAGPGPFTLTVTFGGPVATEPGRASAVLPAVRAGTVRASIEAPGENADVRIEGGLLGARSSAGGRTIVEATLDPRVATHLSWSSRDQAVRAPREARLVTDVKTLVTVGEADLRVASLFDVNVLQGQPEGLDLQVPDGFEVVSVSGGSVETSGQQGSRLSLAVREPARRRHQFLVTFERNVAGGVKHAELPVPAVQGAQRETGEVAWEAVGTVELSAAEAGALRRLDVAEVNPSLALLARSPLLAAFRYQRRGDERVPVAFDVRRFADAPVLGAVAENAVATTLVSSEGRALTEFRLWVKNRGQLFLKVGLPGGATLLSAEVADEPVKPVDAPDGARVPLVRPGFRPTDVYMVSFVYVESGSSLGKKGQAEMKLPRLDLAVEVLKWEVFVPNRYRVKGFEGDVMPETLFVPIEPESPPEPQSSSSYRRSGNVNPDQVSGVVRDTQGGILAGVTVTVIADGYEQQVVTSEQGTFLFSRVPAGPVRVRAVLDGFARFEAELPRAGVSMNVRLEVASMSETVVVRGLSQTKKEAQEPSQNVVNLQSRVSGVLPVRIDVPRDGQAFRFMRTLVLDEETVLRFEYKTR